MSIDDEIRRKKQSMQAAVDDAARKKEENDRLNYALNKAGMTRNSPILRTPSVALRDVITEAMPRMIFSEPKIVRNMPDGTIKVRNAIINQNKKERADDYSFDVVVKRETIDKSTYITSIWFFKNGSVAFTKDGCDIADPGVTPSEIRDKIIETIANSQVVSPKSSNTTNSSSNSSSGGCYIATAVYGSYDCPEVWTLRRFRDYVLQPKWYGRTFIKIYYAISPSLVKLFGNKKWFSVVLEKQT